MLGMKGPLDRDGTQRMMNQRDGNNYYEILEVPPDAPQTEIHKAYQRAKATYSQDNPALYSMFSKEEARELLRMIEEAYAILGNQGLRKSYDEGLMRNQSNSAARSVPAAQNSNPTPRSTPAPAPAQVESAHRALPDFNSPEPTTATTMSSSLSETSEGFKVVKKDNSKQPLPPGTGRTNLSTYKIDDAFEGEVTRNEDWDGAFLQKVRLYKNISLDKMSEATRISRTYLMAVETNDYKNLPAAVFVRGFVVQMCRVLGIEETKVAGSYMKRFKAGGGK